MQLQDFETLKPAISGGLLGLKDSGPFPHIIVSPRDSQGLYYREVMEKKFPPARIENDQVKLTKKRKKRAKGLTDDELQLALSIVGMIKDDIEPDLSENFREYLHK